MSWQCSYCETVNQDAAPICTVCDRIAPVVESFLSLEQISHAQEYEELLSQVYSFEAKRDYDKMMETALKAVGTFTKNDVALSKVHLAIKLAHKEKVQDYILYQIYENIELKDYTTAKVYINLWQHLKLDNDLISSCIETVVSELNEINHKENIINNITQKILNGEFSEALAVIESELITHEHYAELRNIRPKVQNLIACSINKDRPRRIPTPVNKSRHVESNSVDETNSPSIKDTAPKNSKEPVIRKFPKVKRNN